MPTDLISCIAIATSIFAWGPNGVRASLPYGVYGLVCPDGSGGGFVASSDNFRGLYYGLGYQTYLSHLTGSGQFVAGWSTPKLVNDSPTSDAEPLAIQSDGAGGVYVLTSTRTLVTGADVLLAHLDSSGALFPGWPDTGLVVANTRWDEIPKGLCTDGRGGVFAGWTVLTSNTTAIPKVQHFSANGSPAPGWPDTGVVVAPPTIATGVQSMVPDLTGGCYAELVSSSGALVQHLTATGTIAPGWPVRGIPVSSVAANEVTFAGAAVADGQGGVLVAWDDDRVAPNHDPLTPVGNIYAQRFAPDGSRPAGWPAEGLPVCVAPGAHWDAHLCADGTGGALIVWTNPQAPRTMGIQRILGSGQVAPGWPLNGRDVGDNTSSGYLPFAASDGFGGAYLVWLADNVSSLQQFVYVQHVLNDGSTAPGWPATAALLSPPGILSYSTYPSIAQSGNAAIVVWAQGTDFDHGGVWAQKLAADGVVPTQLALRDAHATSTEVSLTWWGAGAAQLGLAVERSIDGSTWSVIGAADVSGSDAITYVDHAVVAGRRYAYRLANSGAAVTSPEWVDVPISAVFALAGSHPNPSPAGQFDVSFSLAERTRGTLELLDVAGRRLAWRDLSALEPGRHVARFSETSTLAPGLYWLRLAQGSRMATARVAIVK